ncbi:lysophospholipid acyltransferase family protein [Actinokineospora sp.]|uniref:lysophospholipid acyltransferase family protein n=1 Tax=Actinokineospora sp. TaxID=1872133 RepID=UPI00403813E7
MQEARVIPLQRADRHRRFTAPTKEIEGPPVEPVPLRPERPAPEVSGVRRGIADAIGFAHRRLAGDYRVDEFGFDPELTDRLLLPPLRLLYRNWFRVEVSGVENLPLDGGALVVCNHSGTLPIDALMTGLAVHDNHPRGRYLRMLGADLVFQVPLLGALARKSGQTLACNPDAEQLLRSGELVGVWPEGFKGVGKPFADRYKLQRFGRGGFVSAALRTGVPIIPCSIVGAEEIYPKIGDLKTVARLLGLPYFPITPFFPLLGPLGAIPLPSKWHIRFGEPIATDDHAVGAADDPMLVFTLADQVRETIQQTLYRMLSQRGGTFFG